MLHRNKALDKFKKVHDIFYRRLCSEMKSPSHHRLSPESQKLIQSFGNLYIQFPKFTYLRIEGFDEEPLCLPKFVVECFVLVEVARQLIGVKNKFSIEEASNVIFPLKLGKLTCRSMEDAT